MIDLIDLTDCGDPILYFSTPAAIYKLDATLVNDNAAAINSYFMTSLVPGPEVGQTGAVNQFGIVRLKAEGVGTLQVSVWGEDRLSYQDLNPVTLQAIPGKEYTNLSNYINERAAVKVQSNLADNWFRINRIVLFSRFYAAQRPR
jgi:hypothetical protein